MRNSLETLYTIHNNGRPIAGRISDHLSHDEIAHLNTVSEKLRRPKTYHPTPAPQKIELDGLNYLSSDPSHLPTKLEKFVQKSFEKSLVENFMHNHDVMTRKANKVKILTPTVAPILIPLDEIFIYPVNGL